MVRRVRDQNGEATIICSLTRKQADCGSWLNTIMSSENLSDCSVKTIAACRGVEFPATVIITQDSCTGNTLVHLEEAVSRSISTMHIIAPERKEYGITSTSLSYLVREGRARPAPEQGEVPHTHAIRKLWNTLTIFFFMEFK